VPLIVDASVAVKWIVAEPLREEALDLLHQNDLVATDLLLAEVRNALVNRVRRRLSTIEQARTAAAAFGAIPLLLERASDQLEQAFDLALALEHPIYDCIYLALALGRGLSLVSADRRLIEVAQRVPELRDRVRPLGEPR
jgi:predicted nucleic acid-binding protein